MVARRRSMFFSIDDNLLLSEFLTITIRLDLHCEWRQKPWEISERNFHEISEPKLLHSHQKLADLSKSNEDRAISCPHLPRLAGFQNENKGIFRTSLPAIFHRE